MKSGRVPRLALIVLAAGLPCCRTLEVSPDGGGALAIVQVDVIPVATPGILRRQTVLVRGDRIAAVGPAAEVAIPRGARTIDGRGLYLIPGLADMHDHLPRGAGPGEYPLDHHFTLQLAAGVTTIRSMRGAPGDVELRAAIERGEREGPRMILGSPGIDGKAAPDPESARAIARAFHQEGYDFLKILGGFSPESFEALAAEARALRMPIAGHWPADLPADAVLRAPYWSIEHLHGHGSAIQSDPAAFGDLARRTVEAGIWICPTLGFQLSWYAQVPVAEMSAWPGMRYASPEAVRDWSEGAAARASSPSAERARFDTGMEARRAAVRRLADAGAGLLVSTSGGWFLIPGFSMYVEFDALIDAGLSPPEILQAATINAARSVRQEDQWGSIEAGRAADMVLLEGDPLQDIGNARRVRAVIRRGRLHDRADLDLRLEQVRRSVAASAAVRSTDRIGKILHDDEPGE